jgi:hypothetical protein
MNYIPLYNHFYNSRNLLLYWNVIILWIACDTGSHWTTLLPVNEYFQQMCISFIFFFFFFQWRNQSSTEHKEGFSWKAKQFACNGFSPDYYHAWKPESLIAQPCRYKSFKYRPKTGNNTITGNSTQKNKSVYFSQENTVSNNSILIIERDVGDGTWWNIFTIT